MVPLLVALPNAFKVLLFCTVRVSPLPLSVSVPKLPDEPEARLTGAVAVPMVTASALLGTPALQLPEVPQLLSPALPFHESAVRAGGALCVAGRAPATLAASCGLDTGCCESLCFDPPASCAEVKPLRVRRAASRQRTVIHELTTREDAGRMGNSTRTDSVGTSATLILFSSGSQSTNAVLRNHTNHGRARREGRRIIAPATELSR